MVEEVPLTFTGMDDWTTEDINDFLDFFAVLLAVVRFFPDISGLALVLGSLDLLLDLEDFDGVALALEVDFVLFDPLVFLADVLLPIVWPASSTDFSQLIKNF